MDDTGMVERLAHWFPGGDWIQNMDPAQFALFCVIAVPLLLVGPALLMALVQRIWR